MLTGAGALVAGSALAPLLRLPMPARAAEASAFSTPLRQMPVLTADKLDIPMVQMDVPVLQGERTLMWTFDGTFPGPTIRRPAGSTTEVTFSHHIPNTSTFTIHNHGHHNEAVHDGQPMSELIEPGASRTYVYKHVEEGKPLRGGMRWYHDHSHGRTNQNSWMGLLGLFIVEDPDEQALALPAGERELLLVLTTRTFDAANQLVDPFSRAEDPGADAVGSGQIMLVNGSPRPYFEVEPTTYRVRILNAASFSPYNVGFASGGPKIVQVGNESGLWPEPAERERVLMGPAERCDLVVDFSTFAGRSAVLDSAPQEVTSPLGPLFPPAAAPEEPLMEFRVKPQLERFEPPVAVPTKLRTLPAWTAELPATPNRLFVFGQGITPEGKRVWTINGEPYDHETVAAQPELGSTETWLLVNLTAQSHYIHLHDVDWKVVSRNGGAPAADEAGLKETFRLDPGETLAVGTKFTDHLGRFLIHCHMLSHEDHAMMTTFEVVAPGSGDPAVPPFDRLTAEEALRTRALLATQARRPGAPARVPTEPLRLSAQLNCPLEES
jgi:FtsP/CotA-like multicopper oxidase with cupredoxin domain